MISPDNTPDLPNFAETFARQSSWEWNFGRAPAFSHLLDERFRWGGVELHFDVEKGHITRAQAFTDSLNPAPLEAPGGTLSRLSVSGRSITAAVRGAGRRFPGAGSGTERTVGVDCRRSALIKKARCA